MTFDYRAALRDLLTADVQVSPLREDFERALAEADKREYDSAARIALDTHAHSLQLVGEAHRAPCLLLFMCCDLLARANEPDRAAQQLTRAIRTLATAVAAGFPAGDEAAAGLIQQLLAAAVADSRLQPAVVAFARDEDNVKAISDPAMALLAGEPGQARLLMQAVLTVRRLTRGADHDDTLIAAHKLAAALIGVGDFQAAETLARDSYERRVRRHGLGHTLAQRAAGAYAAALFKNGRKREALALALQIYQASRGAHGEDHQQTKSALSNLLEMQKSA